MIIRLTQSQVWDNLNGILGLAQQKQPGIHVQQTMVGTKAHGGPFIPEKCGHVGSHLLEHTAW